MSTPRTLSAGRGFTLVEVILAMALTAIVLLIVATGISVQLRAFDTSRARVERAQLARVLLHGIADDLRGLLPPGDGGGQKATTSASADAESSKSQDDASDLAASLFSGQSEDETAEETEDELDADTVEAEAGASTPGVYGGLDWLRIDLTQAVRRVAASSEASEPTTESLSQSPRQLETIIYYVVPHQEDGASATSTELQRPSGGLVRRQLAQPAATRAAELGLLNCEDPSLTPLAPEVRAIEFRYHDGDDWVESWDMQTSGGLPAAIEIRLFLSPIPRRDTSLIAAAAEEQPEVQYRLIVSITVKGAGSSSWMDALGDSVLGDESSDESKEGSSTESAAGGDSNQSGGRQ
jgi:prepilin-type N-terminal cleavage/methylation domain-containing protein